MTVQNELGGLEFTIGGDDAEPASESTINVNGLKGKEFIYHFADAKTPEHRRGRIIDARTRIFVPIYATKTASGLNSSAAVQGNLSLLATVGTPNKSLDASGGRMADSSQLIAIS